MHSKAEIPKQVHGVQSPETHSHLHKHTLFRTLELAFLFKVWLRINSSAIFYLSKIYNQKRKFKISTPQQHRSPKSLCLSFSLSLAHTITVYSTKKKTQFQQPPTATMMLPPSPSPSMSKFHHYYQQQQRPPSSSSSPNSGGGSESSSYCSSTASIQTAISSSSTATAVPMEVDDSPQLFPMLPPPVPPSVVGGSSPRAPGAGSSLSLAGVTRHMRITYSTHSTASHAATATTGSSSSSNAATTAFSNSAATNNALVLSTVPLRRLRSSLRRHSVSGIS